MFKIMCSFFASQGCEPCFCFGFIIYMTLYVRKRCIKELAKCRLFHRRVFFFFFSLSRYLGGVNTLVAFFFDKIICITARISFTDFDIFQVQTLIVQGLISNKAEKTLTLFSHRDRNFRNNTHLLVKVLTSKMSIHVSVYLVLWKQVHKQNVHMQSMS